MTEPQHPASMRAGDADRERSVELLRQAVVEGRLELEEFTDRVGLAQRARTESELSALTRDLPAAAPGPAGGPERHLALCPRLVRSGRWELSARASFRCLFGTVVRSRREHPSSETRALGHGEPVH